MPTRWRKIRRMRRSDCLSFAAKRSVSADAEKAEKARLAWQPTLLPTQTYTGKRFVNVIIWYRVTTQDLSQIICNRRLMFHTSINLYGRLVCLTVFAFGSPLQKWICL